MERRTRGYAAGAWPTGRGTGTGRPAETRRSATAARDPHFSETLPPDPGSVARARHLIRRLLADSEAGVDVDAAGLLTSELVTNAIRHAGTPVELLARVNETLHVEVTDGRPELPVTARDADGFAVSGRGLHLVEELASRWGVQQRDGTKTVWFELDRRRA